MGGRAVDGMGATEVTACTLDGVEEADIFGAKEAHHIVTTIIY